MRPLPVPPGRKVVAPPHVNKRYFLALVETERWGEADGPEIEIELPIKPRGKVVVSGKDTWGRQVPVPSQYHLARATPVAPRAGEKYRFILLWSGGAQWRVAQKARRRARKGEGATTRNAPE